MSLSIIQLASLLILFTSCLSQANKPKQSSGTRDTLDSCSIAKPFENIQMTESMVKADYTGVLNNFIGSDTTKLDYQHFFENGKLMKSVFYYPNGKVQEAYNYKCGALNGNQQYFYSDGKLAKIIPYSYGYREGVGKIYDEKGNLRQQVIFTADSMIGQPKTFDEKGNLLK